MIAVRPVSRDELDGLGCRNHSQEPADVRGVMITEEADQTVRDIVKEIPVVTIRSHRVTIELAA